MEEKERRGLSLRKKKTVRPKISAPTQISEPAANGTSAQRERPRLDGTTSKQNGAQSQPSQSENTSDLVKRRYSTRFTQLPVDLDSGAPPVPAVPAIPGQFIPQTQDGRPSRGGEKITVDIKVLQDPDLRPEQYVAGLLADATEEEIYNYQQDLRKVKNRTSIDLQHNVYQNRAEFIKISKQADRLKGELRTLRTLMSELTSSLGQSSISDRGSDDTMAARKRVNRSSVANLEALWSTQLHTIWKQVEGSQKYLPAIPGRHVVWQSPHWVELNNATLKPRRRVHMFLLNDHLMIASEKKRIDTTWPNAKENSHPTGLAHTHLVAEQCWPLQDVDLSDLASQPIVKNIARSGDKSYAANAISIRVGGESFTYATRSAYGPEKGIFLGHFRRTAEELRKMLYSETEKRDRTRDSVNYYATRNSGLLNQKDLVDRLSENALHNKSSMMIDVDGKQQSIRWVESQVDDLDIHIALQRFEEAVRIVERLRRIAKGIKNNQLAHDIVSLQLDKRATKLADILTKELVGNSSGMTFTRKHVGWLIRLGFEDRAREAYLDARTTMVRKRARQCMFEGDLQQYTHQLSYVYFTIIKNTISVYQSCFPPVMMSACVKWVKEHVDDFNVILARQLSGVDPSSEVWHNCIERAQHHAAMLNEVGMDFKDLVGRNAKVEAQQEEGPVGLGLISS